MFRCLFTLKTPKTIYLNSGRIFVLGKFWVFGWFIGLLVAIDWFKKVFKVFSKCFESKMDWKLDFGLKKQRTLFFQSLYYGLTRRCIVCWHRRRVNLYTHTHTLGVDDASSTPLNYKKNKRWHIIFLYILRVDDASFAPLNYIKKIKARVRANFLLGQVLGLTC